MAEFIVRTWEHVAGTYRVQANSERQARAHFGDPEINWSDVEQLDYIAFSCEVREVVDA